MEEQMPEQRALSVRDQRNIEILGDQILAVRTMDGVIYLPLRALCDTLGLSRPAQVRRIQRDEELREDFREIQVETAGGVQTIQALRVEVVPFWLAGVTISKVKPELQEKLRAYRRWVVRKVYEAFMLEIGLDTQGNRATDDVELHVAPSATLIALEQVREMGRAMMQLAESQMELERRQSMSESRLERAAIVVADIQRRLTTVERRIDPKNVVTEEQAAVISSRVKALAMLLTSQDPSKNHFGGIFGELYRRCRVSDYKSIRQDQFDDVIQFLDEWHDAVITGEAK
jgi:hypothetical protein